MTAWEATMSDRPTDGPTSEDEEYYPEFRTVRRGYDPDQVEQVLDDLYSSLNDAAADLEQRAVRERAAEAERRKLEAALAAAERRLVESADRVAPAADPIGELGARVSAILSAAAVEARETTRRAQEQAQALHDEAKAASVTQRAEADHYASDVRERAEQQAVAITAAARAEADALQSQASTRREAQERADAEALQRLTAELEERKANAEKEFVASVAAHDLELRNIKAEIDAATAELADVRSRSAAEMERLLADARTQAATVRAEAEDVLRAALQQRARVRAQLADVRERLTRVLAADSETPARPRFAAEAVGSTLSSVRPGAAPEDEPGSELPVDSPRHRAHDLRENGVH